VFGFFTLGTIMAHPNNDAGDDDEGLPQPDTPPIPPGGKPEDPDRLLPQPDTPPIPPP
jgi:hypothetical protein